MIDLINNRTITVKPGTPLDLDNSGHLWVIDVMIAKTLGWKFEIWHETPDTPQSDRCHLIEGWWHLYEPNSEVGYPIVPKGCTENEAWIVARSRIELPIYYTTNPTHTLAMLCGEVKVQILYRHLRMNGFGVSFDMGTMVNALDFPMAVSIAFLYHHGWIIEPEGE